KSLGDNRGMELNRTENRSHLARWARHVAVFGVQVLVVGIVLHRFLSISTPLALNLFKTALGFAVVAVILALAAYVGIWRDGRSGGWNAAAGLGLGLAMLAWPVVLVPTARSLPAIHDISTDTNRPPSFVELAKLRPRDANPTAYGGEDVAEQQQAAYPDIKPLYIERSVSDAWDIMGETLRGLKWHVVAEVQPAGPGVAGRYEAYTRTLILGFYDDVVVRIVGNSRSARIDVRSQSRYGRHDFGANAKRVRRLLKEFEVRLAATVARQEHPRRSSNRSNTDK
ncbi:MAG: DUF1499 domain-containing protein, partial [Hyphomicrobiaceae bacterium]